jgi:signal transduction histidine kinase
MSENFATILIVDDEDVIRNICSRSLKSRGYNVILAVNGVKALEQLREHSVDIVFTDYKMPIMNGIELLERIKIDFAHIEVVMMTAFATIESAIQAMKNGAYDFILKPVKPDQIRLVAEKCFEKIKLGEENKLLKAANQKLLDLQEMKNKFIAITSHELRTPVSHLKGYINILNDEYYYQLSKDEKQQCMRVIINSVNDLESLVANMHDLINIETTHTLRNTSEVIINDLVRHCVDAQEIIAKRRKINLTSSDASDQILIVGDPIQLKAVIDELIQNAIKFTPDGGEIHVSLDLDGEYCEIAVKDNGIGIEDSEQGKIFEKFYEVQSSDYHSTSKEAFLGGGMGLGLSYVQAILEAHGGGVKVRSKKSEGSEFKVFLPLQIKSPEA